MLDRKRDKLHRPSESLFARLAESQVLVTTAFQNSGRRNEAMKAIMSELSRNDSFDPHFKSQLAGQINRPNARPAAFLTSLKSSAHQDLSIVASKKPLTQTEAPPEVDVSDPAFRYDSKYVPVNSEQITPLQSMKYNLSKQQLKLNERFKTKLTDAILSGRDYTLPKMQLLFLCSGCEFLLFRDQDILPHVPEKAVESDQIGQALLNRVSSVQLETVAESSPKRSRVVPAQKLSCCEHFVRQRDWMIFGFPP